MGPGEKKCQGGLLAGSCICIYMRDGADTFAFPCRWDLGGIRCEKGGASPLYFSFVHVHKNISLRSERMTKYGDWSHRHVYEAIRGLENLTELLFPVQSHSKSFLDYIPPSVATLHLYDMNRESIELTKFFRGKTLPGVRSLSLIQFKKVTFSDFKAILLAFPDLLCLSIRFTGWDMGGDDWEKRMIQDPEFADRPEGWLDRSFLDHAGLPPSEEATTLCVYDGHGILTVVRALLSICEDIQRWYSEDGGTPPFTISRDGGKVTW